MSLLGSQTGNNDPPIMEADIEAAQTLFSLGEAGKPTDHRESTHDSSFNASTDVMLVVTADRLHRAVAAKKHSGLTPSIPIAAAATLHKRADVTNLEYDSDKTIDPLTPVYDSDETIPGGFIDTPTNNSEEIDSEDIIPESIKGPPIYNMEETDDNSINNGDQKTSTKMNEKLLESNISKEESHPRMYLSTQAPQPPVRTTAYRQSTALKKSTASKRSRSQEPKIRKTAADLDREREATKRARRNEEMDAGIANLLDEWMTKADGDLEKAMDIAAAAGEQFNQRPWPLLEESTAFIESMKKDILDPQELQRRMQKEEEEEEEQHQRRNRRVGRTRGRKSSKQSTAASMVRSEPQTLASEQVQAAKPLHYKPVTQQSELLPTTQEDDEQLTTPTNTSGNSKSRAAARGKQMVSSTALQKAEMLMTSANTTQAPPAQSRTLDLPPAAPGKRTRKTAADDLETNLGEKWKVHVTSDGRRPCVKSQHESKSQHDGQPSKHGQS
ncbi:hypothetical protein HD806DRAFT_331037 [Xylariaceae sp. AK1471]|nr:hypothetical protein HD806DRAFT_331037 [Xylariaceae sp. AK1471]